MNQNPKSIIKPWHNIAILLVYLLAISVWVVAAIRDMFWIGLPILSGVNGIVYLSLFLALVRFYRRTKRRADLRGLSLVAFISLFSAAMVFVTWTYK
ncbi:MAG TPA: hypothetical protein VK395_22150 [Gemmataceae bacterium]|nr:hypothetical protein [Gemmataceae bacterium]